MAKFKYVMLIVLSSILGSYAQTKNEKESRISLQAFPEQAQVVVKSVISKVKRVRHFKEIDGNHESYESKFKYQKRWFSVEFNKLGQLEDIEITIKERQLDDSVKIQITSYLKSRFVKFDFLKIQEQFVSKTNAADQNFLIKVLEQITVNLDNYEIIVAAKNDKTWDIREMTFNASGQFVNERIIQQDSYEYIMY